MTFNNGFYCPNCGPIPRARTRSRNKVRVNTCHNCEAVVTVWERPLNERIGRCGNCANGWFKLAVVKGQLLRCCKVCDEVVNTDKNNEITREGDKKHEYKPGEQKQRIG